MTTTTTTIIIAAIATLLPSVALSQCPIGDSVVAATIDNDVSSNQFRDCVNLKDVTISATGCESITSSGFYGTGTFQLDSITFETSSGSSALRVIGSNAFEAQRSIESVILPVGLTEIQSFALGYMDSMTTLHIPDSVTKIGIAFARSAGSLTDLRLPNPNPESTLSFNTRGWFNGAALTTFTNPSYLTVIGELAFYGNSDMTYLELQGDVTVESRAFEGTTSLRNFKISPTATIAAGAFSYSACEESMYIPGADVCNCGECVTINPEISYTGCGNLQITTCSQDGSGVTINGQNVLTSAGGRNRRQLVEDQIEVLNQKISKLEQRLEKLL